MMFDFAEKRPSEIPIVVLDTETTGLMPEMGHRVIEIGAVRYENGQEVAKLNRLLNPKRKIEPSASRVNGIEDADLIGQLSFASFSQELIAFLDGALIVAHNARFDAGFLGMEFYIQGIQAKKPAFKLENPWLCTFELAKNYFHFGRNSLGHIANLLGVRMGQSHRALNDVYATAGIFKRMQQELSKQRFETVGDLLYIQGGAIFSPYLEVGAISIDPLRIGLQEGKNVSIHYSSAKATSTRIISPLYITYLNGSAYIVAYCHQAQDQRTFKLDRILNSRLT